MHSDRDRGHSSTLSFMSGAVCAWLVVAGVVSSFGASVSFAQVPSPDRKNVFYADSPAGKREQATNVKQATAGGGKAAPGVDFQAPSIQFDRNKNEVIGSGGVLISEAGVQLQADQGSYNTETKVGTVSGNVVVSSSQGVLNADTAAFQMESETGEFTKLEADIEDGGFNVQSEKARKVSEFEFELDDSSFTTCHCADGTRPWEVQNSSCSITKEGYARAHGSRLYFEGMPVFYSPYLVFPVKNERASGLLPPQWGISNQDGFMYKQPILGIIDDSSDVTFSPFIATRSRRGAELQYQQIFSKRSKLSTGILYSDESPRGDDPRGLNLDGVSDPTIDQNRIGGYYKHRWTPDPTLQLPVEFIADGRYTSDNLFLREIPEANIGDKQSQFLTSTAVLRGMMAGGVTAEARAEYNQMLLTDQDVQTQRLPEIAIGGTQTFKPWGFNPYGLKVVTGGSAVGTDFVRNDGYDGWRYDFVPQAAVPFHIANYMKGQFTAQLHQTQYNLSETMLPSTATPLPDGSTELASSSSRTLPILSYQMGTAVERIFDVDRDGWLSRLTSVGARNERTELVRLKHTIEPTVKYTYIPDVDQSDLPLFDQVDRYRQRSLIDYGFTSRLYGRFMEPYERVRDVEELTPSSDALPVVDLGASVLEFGQRSILSPTQNIDLRSGKVRQLALFSVRQTYDQNLASSASNPDSDPFSDLNLGVSFSPTSYLSAGAQTNYHLQDSSFSSYALSLGFMDDRSDMARLRYTFVDDSVQQFEGNAEVALLARFRAGMYLRYDTLENQVIETRGLVRFVNSCKCWSADLGYGETINPDRQQVLFTFTFGGLGGITQGIGLPQQAAQQ